MPYKDKEKLKEYNRKYQREHKEEKKEYDKKCYKENKEEILRKQREYRQRLEVKEKRKEYDKEYRQRPEVKVRQNEHSKEYRKNNPKKVNVRAKAYYHLKYLKEPFKEFHHPDYNKPLLVEVLPIAEHKALHARQNQLNQMRAAVLAV